MSHAILTVNGHTKFDGPIDNWQRQDQPPAELLELTATIKRTFQPELIAAMLAISQAAAARHSVTVDVNSHNQGWTIKVRHT